MEKAGSSSTLILNLPDKLWLGKLSREFPYFYFQISSFMPINQEPAIGNSLIKITGRNPKRLLEKIKSHPSLVSLQLLEDNPTSITIETQTKDQFLLRSMVKNRILVKLPVIVESGNAVFNIIATRNNIDEFVQDLTTKKGIQVKIKKLGNYTDDFLELNLTERQYFIYKKAKESGFYDSPRKINLTELAKELNLAKSSLSSILQRIHKKLLGGE